MDPLAERGKMGTHQWNVRYADLISDRLVIVSQRFRYTIFQECNRVRQLSEYTAHLPRWGCGTIHTLLCKAQFLLIILAIISANQSAEAMYLRWSGFHGPSLLLFYRRLPCLPNSSSWTELSSFPGTRRYQGGSNHVHRPWGYRDCDRFVHPGITDRRDFTTSVRKATKDWSYFGFHDRHYVRASSPSELQRSSQSS